MDKPEPTMEEVLESIRKLFVQVTNGYHVDKQMIEKAEHAYKLLGYALKKGVEQGEKV